MQRKSLTDRLKICDHNGTDPDDADDLITFWAKLDHEQRYGWKTESSNRRLPVQVPVRYQQC